MIKKYALHTVVGSGFILLVEIIFYPEIIQKALSLHDLVNSLNEILNSGNIFLLFLAFIPILTIIYGILHGKIIISKK